MKKHPIFNVIIFDPNKKDFVPYDVMPYFFECWNKLKVKFTEYEDIKKYLLAEAQYQFWSRCEYEVILTDWPCQKTEKKIDVYNQIETNIDVITKLFIDYIKK